MFVYKILRPSEWQELQSQGEFHGSEVDLQDGFIHFSTHDTVEVTAQKHFASQTDLTLLAVDVAVLQGLKWEPSRGGLLFPHLYNRLYLNQVLWFSELPYAHDKHHFPKLTP